MLDLSVLDQSPISEGMQPAGALHNSVDLARHTEALGYRRYWVAEHHGTPMLACNSPEVLVGAIAAATEEIRVGSGGVMLPHHSPLEVAEAFSMLNGLHPGRIDLGLGRAPGTDQITALALQRDRRRPVAGPAIAAAVCLVVATSVSVSVIVLFTALCGGECSFS